MSAEQTTEIASATIDAAHLANQREWSGRTFGPGTRLLGVLDHIRKELREIEASPGDVEEWVDVIILAFDGAWRAGWEPQQIIDAIKAKQAKNEARTWPDWRTASPDAAIEHVRESFCPEGCTWPHDHRFAADGHPWPQRGARGMSPGVPMCQETHTGAWEDHCTQPLGHPSDMAHLDERGHRWWDR